MFMENNTVYGNMFKKAIDNSYLRTANYLKYHTVG